jgi:formyltetrahydrofolate deformylase
VSRADYVLALNCPDRPGIAHAITSFLVEHGVGDVVDYQQFDDQASGALFLRASFAAVTERPTLAGLRAAFGPVAAAFAMDWQLYDAAHRPRTLVMVSRFDHCLNDLLYRWRSDQLGADIDLVVSNHTDLRAVVEAAGVEFVHIPVTAGTKPEAEARLLQLVDDRSIDLVVLARYMQVLSAPLCSELAGRAINIHHSFLPSFAGARPYHQAYQRGVKLVGATAHYVTADLDDGPIIEQEVIRIDHTLSPEELVRIGRDAECVALARAVRWHSERRVLINGQRTVVFR